MRTSLACFCRCIRCRSDWRARRQCSGSDAEDERRPAVHHVPDRRRRSIENPPMRKPSTPPKRRLSPTLPWPPECANSTTKRSAVAISPDDSVIVVANRDVGDRSASSR